MATQSVVDLQDGRAWAAANPAVRAFDVGRKKSSGSHMLCFDEVLQNHTRKLFIKIDDDIVYIRAGAFAYLAANKMFHSSMAFRQDGLVSANVVNHGHLAYGECTHAPASVGFV